MIKVPVCPRAKWLDRSRQFFFLAIVWEHQGFSTTSYECPFDTRFYHLLGWGRSPCKPMSRRTTCSFTPSESLRFGIDTNLCTVGRSRSDRKRPERCSNKNLQFFGPRQLQRKAPPAGFGATGPPQRLIEKKAMPQSKAVTPLPFKPPPTFKQPPGPPGLPGPPPMASSVPRGVKAPPVKNEGATGRCFFG